MRKLLWFLLPIPLLLLILYTALPYVARTLIEQWLTQQGFDAPQIRLTHPSWDRLIIPSLSLAQQGPERRIELQARDIDIRFEPMALLLENALTEIRIPRLQLQIRADKSLEQRLDDNLDATFDLNQLPPALLFHYAPSDRLVIGQLSIEYQAPRQPRLSASGNLDLTSTRLLSRMRLALEAPHGDDRTLPAPAYLDLDFSASQWLELSLVQDNRHLFESRGQLTTDVQQWELNLDGTVDTGRMFSWLRPLLPSPPFAALEGTLSFGLTSQWPARLPVQPEALLNRIRGRLLLDNRLSLTELTLAETTHIGQLQSRLNGELSLDQGLLTLDIAAPGHIVAGPVLRPEGRAEQIGVELTQPLSISAALLNEGMLAAVKPVGLRLTPQALSLPELSTLALSPISVEITPSPTLDSVHFAVRSDAVQATLRQLPLPAIALAVDGHWHADDLSGELQLSSAQPALALTADWRYRDRFYARWRLAPASLTQTQTALKSLLTQWPYDLTFSNGTLAMTGTLVAAGADQWELSADATVRDAALAWDTYMELDNLDADLTLTRHVDGTLGSRGTLQAELIDAGVNLHDTRLRYQLTQPARGAPELQLEPLTLHLLGGELYLPALTFNPLAPAFETRARLDAIQLGDILRLYDQPGLSGSSTLSGTLPVQVNGQQIRVQGGHISSATPGWIRYQPSAELSATAQGNPALKLALSALTDLQLSELALDLNYAPDGALELRTRLRGHNPDWQQGRPIDLSLNIEENLLQLLRALQLSERIGDRLREQLAP
jgi:hypothetical protein